MIFHECEHYEVPAGKDGAKVRRFPEIAKFSALKLAKRGRLIPYTLPDLLNICAVPGDILDLLGRVALLAGELRTGKLHQVFAVVDALIDITGTLHGLVDGIDLSGREEVLPGTVDLLHDGGNGGNGSRPYSGESVFP